MDSSSKALPSSSALSTHFAFDPSVVYLNHGSFGACPTKVLEAQARHRDEVEADAMQFYINSLWPKIDRSREALGRLINAEPRDLVFVSNATTAVATVLDNLQLKPGDELLIPNFEYQACINNCRRTCERTGAKLIIADLPWEQLSEESVVDAIMSKVTERTKLVMLSLITSATAIRLPVETLIKQLNDRGIDTLLDAAHGPGCVPMDLKAWDAAYSTGNAHKWLCNPKGAAFLHVRQDRQDGFRPMVLSNDAYAIEEAAADSGRTPFNHEFDYMGTDDRTAALSVADSIEFLDSLMPGGINDIMEHNLALCFEARNLLRESLGNDDSISIPDSLLGPLATIDLPGCALAPRLLRERLFANHRIECMVVPSPTRGYPMVRISPYIYNSIEQYQYLADAIRAEINAEIC